MGRELKAERERRIREIEKSIDRERKKQQSIFDETSKKSGELSNIMSEINASKIILKEYTSNIENSKKELDKLNADYIKLQDVMVIHKKGMESDRKELDTYKNKLEAEYKAKHKNLYTVKDDMDKQLEMMNIKTNRLLAEAEGIQSKRESMARSEASLKEQQTVMEEMIKELDIKRILQQQEADEVSKGIIRLAKLKKEHDIMAKKLTGLETRLKSEKEFIDNTREALKDREIELNLREATILKRERRVEQLIETKELMGA